MPGDSAWYYIKMLVYKKVYQYFLHVGKKERKKGDRIYFSERTRIDSVTSSGAG